MYVCIKLNARIITLNQNVNKKDRLFFKLLFVSFVNFRFYISISNWSQRVRYRLLLTNVLDKMTKIF